MFFSKQKFLFFYSLTSPPRAHVSKTHKQCGLEARIFFFIDVLKTFIQVNDSRLRSAGEASQRSTREDWAEWMRHFSIQLLKESPSPALRTCARLAQLQVASDICIIHCSMCVVLFSYLIFIYTGFYSLLLGENCLQLDLSAVGHSSMRLLRDTWFGI